jgi:hypothetical protein
MIRFFSAGVAIFALLAACGEKSDAPAARAPGATSGTMGAATYSDLNSELPLKELMAHVIDYNAFSVWHNQGWLIDFTGEHELFPTDDIGWHEAESAAITLAEASNLLLLPGRPPDDDRRWVDYTHALRDAAMKVQATAERREKQAFFDAGGDLYQACVQCHNHYIIGDEPGPAATLPPMPGQQKPSQ